MELKKVNELYLGQVLKVVVSFSGRDELAGGQQSEFETFLSDACAERIINSGKFDLIKKGEVA